MSASPLSFALLLDGLKAAGEDTRLRLLALIGEGELTVSELTEILGQSQPRISRHLKLLAEAGLVERFREASWVFYRRATDAPGAALTDALLDLMAPDDDILLRDRERLEAVRAARAEQAQAYFRAHAHEWDAIRRLHAPETEVESAIKSILSGQRVGALLDLGTGTGRILELFADEMERGVGIDLSAEMLAVARANLERAGVRNATVRQGDIYNLALPRDAFDVVVIHQVLHFLEDAPRALKEAARVLRPGGRLLVVDFDPHDLEFLREQHAHRRLGFAPEIMESWLAQAGLSPQSHRLLAPKGDGRLTVSLWLARDPRVVLAQAPQGGEAQQKKEVA
ncbi:transcriptional regulator, ArsR family [Ancylobacter novellus DSM 506]|uniref:Transcriptional regulator, ArsR family n=1 Tax=Ancylobacter novellus (strain ATCC 8093 / DSM 506 / JCM 20403 / CCM 1077 / IAM 12100 / NBRC 12443 / NCIMB 10456) TaxID=639283 RepID=D7A2F5_ANCN5|nr:metalloregulator ArsR/SmtB family transcription factor [Ancylobacter novellus]ADH89618.1 transcriptional regulator, ArsR family [Ancylobacter novellus DSM 506]